MKKHKSRMTMKSIIDWKKTTAAVWLTVLCLPLFAQEDAQGTIVDKIIVKVDNYIILKSDLESAYMQRLTNGEELGPNARCEILQQLVINKVMVAKAEIDSVVVDEAMVSGELDSRMQYFVMQAGGEDKLEQTLGKKLSVLREELRDQVKEQMTVQQMQNTITAELSVTPAEVKKYFNGIPKDSIPFLPAEAKVGQILKFPEVSQEEKDKARNLLLGVRARVEAGENFAEIARQISEDFSSAREGGDLGWHGRGELVPEFEATALRLEINEISDPIESEFGFHLIQLLERRGNRFHARHILIRPKANENDVVRAMNLMDSVRTLIMTDSLEFENAAKEYSDDQATRSNAGYFQDPNTGGSMVSTENLDPVVFFTIDTMQVGHVSAPMRFRTDDGKTAVRMIYYEQYIPPHYANLKDDYQKLFTAAKNRKKAGMVRDWLNKAKREVFIDIDPDYQNCNVVNQL